MAGTNPIRGTTIQLQPNVPVELTLKYKTGREVANGRVMFTTMSDDRLFLDPADAAKIHLLRLGVYEPFRIVKSVEEKVAEIVVSRVGKQRPEPRSEEGPAAPAAAESNTLRPAQGQLPQPKNISMSGILASAYIAAIDALILAKQYADSKGVTFHITEERIGCAASCVFIEVGKQADRLIREREYNARYGSTCQ